MNSNIVKIQISGLPAIFPTADWTGKVNTYQRVIQIGNHSEVVVTEQTWKTIYDENYQQRTIQSITYDKYQLRIPANEHLRVDLIEHAKFVYVDTQDEVRHKAKVLSVDYAKETGTELGGYTIEYADINPQNYKNQQLPINNFLESSQLLNEFEASQLVKIDLVNSQSIDDEWAATGYPTFYTELLPYYDVSETEEESEKSASIEKVTRSSNARLLHVKFFLTESDKNTVAKYLPLCDQVTLTDPLGSRLAVERVMPEIEPIGTGLWSVDVKLKYNVLNYYPENT